MYIYRVRQKISVYFEALQRSNFEVETFYNTA